MPREGFEVGCGVDGVNFRTRIEASSSVLDMGTRERVGVKGSRLLRVGVFDPLTLPGVTTRVVRGHTRSSCRKWAGLRPEADRLLLAGGPVDRVL